MTHDDDVLPDRQGAAAAATGDDETEAEVAAAAERATDGNAARSEERRCSAEQQEAAAIVEQMSVKQLNATRAASEGPIDDGRTSLMTERRRGGCTYVPMSVRLSTSSNGRNPIEASSLSISASVPVVPSRYIATWPYLTRGLSAT